MDKTDGSITSSYGDWTREDFLFTYSEQEKQENKRNKNNAGLINNVEFYPIYTEYNWKMSLEAKVLMWFFRYRCKNGKKIYQKNEDLSILLECSESTVKKTLKELKELWLLEYSVTPIVWWWSDRVFWLPNTEGWNSTLPRGEIYPPYKNYSLYTNFFSFDILVEYEIYIAELFENFPEEKLEQYKDILEDFVVYRCETDKKWTPRRKKEKTRSLGWRLSTRKKRADTNFWRNKPQLPTESLQNAAVMYYMNRNNPKQQKPYKEYLEKYWVLDKRKEYATMKLGSWFIS